MLITKLLKGNGQRNCSKPVPELRPVPPPSSSFSIEIRGSGHYSGVLPVKYQAGWSIRRYLRILKMTAHVRGFRMIDTAHPELGRRRMSYVPQPDSRVVILPIAMSTAQQFQRATNDATSSSSTVEEVVDMRYKP